MSYRPALLQIMMPINHDLVLRPDPLGIAATHLHAPLSRHSILPCFTASKYRSLRESITLIHDPRPTGRCLPFTSYNLGYAKMVCRDCLAYSERANEQCLAHSRFL